MGLYGIGQPVPREEDPRLLMGKGRYADDVSPAGLVHGVVLRSTFAHAVIRSIDGRAYGNLGYVAIGGANDCRQHMI